MRRIELLALLASLAACRPACPPVPPPLLSTVGCSKDTDCKGARVCVEARCVDPSSPTPPALASSDAGAPDLAVLPPGPDAGASPVFHVDWRHQGRSRFPLPAKRPREHARVVTQGVVYGSPAVAEDGTAYFGSHDGRVRAVTPDGSVRWTQATGDLVWCSPALAPDGGVYVGSDDDHLYAFDAETGRLRWKFAAGPCQSDRRVGPEASRCDVDGVTPGPGGAIYFVADGIYGLRADGSLIFRFPLRTHCAGAPAVGRDGTIYAGCQDGALYALTPAGEKRWEYRTAGDIDGAPTILPDGKVVFGSDDGKLYALDARGVLQWALQAGAAIRSSPALGANGHIYVGTMGGVLYAVEPNGRIAWMFRATDRIVSSPVVSADGAILFGCEDDRLYALDHDGRLRWSLLLGGDVDGTPALGPDGLIYVGADDKALHLLR